MVHGRAGLIASAIAAATLAITSCGDASTTNASDQAGVPVVETQPARSGEVFEVVIDDSAMVNGNVLFLHTLDGTRAWMLSWSLTSNEVGLAFEVDDPREIVYPVSLALLDTGTSIFARTPDDISGVFRLCYDPEEQCSELEVGG